MSVIKTIEDSQKKSKITDVKSGDVVRVHQRITEGNKERVQVFEGLVIRTKRGDSFTRTITVRRIASGVGVEKSFLVHSPFITQIEVIKRSKVRRNYLSYMRERSGKSARLESVKFDQDEVNVPANFNDAPAEADVAEEVVAETPAVEAQAADANPKVEEKA
jgi:large subunit ribosomal protein L19